MHPISCFVGKTNGMDLVLQKSDKKMFKIVFVVCFKLFQNKGIY